jgi:type II secretory pathway pseudopilin PulG
MRAPGSFSSRRAFTMIDVLVSITVVAILISIMLPTLGRVNETARRAVCQSNIRQIGLGMIMYADDWKGQLPPSQFIPGSNSRSRNADYEPQRTVQVRVPLASGGMGSSTSWDGLGLLFQLGYVSAGKVFYCPSHWGENPYSRYAAQWSPDGGEITCNFHFRGQGPTRPGSGAAPYGTTTTALYMIDPAQSSLIADSMQVVSDYNHKVGVNFFRADLTVHWFADPAGDLLNLLPKTKEDADAAQSVQEAWQRFDRSVLPPG